MRPEVRTTTPATRTLVIACGALARELVALTRRPGLEHIDLTCLPASLHNRPGGIPAAVRRRIVEGGEIHALGAANSNVIHIDAAVGQAPAQCVGEAGAREADVAADHDALRVKELRIAAADAIGHVIVQFGGNPAAQIIGLEARDRIQFTVPSRP